MFTTTLRSALKRSTILERLRSLDGTYRQLLQHGSVFGAGAIIARIASILLLPVYTRYLAPADYAVLAILDLTINLLGIVAGAGVAAAAIRAHFAHPDERTRDAGWWTALTMQAVAGAVVILVALPFSGSLSALMFGSDLRGGSGLVMIALASLAVSGLIGVLDAYLRATKASGFYLHMSLWRLGTNILLNLTLLIAFHLGVAAVLWGNLLSGSLILGLKLARFVRTRGRYAIDRQAASAFWRFGWPFVISGLLSAVMHDADRYMLRIFDGLTSVGIYSLGYQVGQGINSLALMPFEAIWIVLAYEIASQPDSRATYGRVFSGYVMGVGLLLLCGSMFAYPLLTVATTPAYAEAADIVPIVCLGYLLFGLHSHFKLPALLHDRTVALLPVVSAAAVVNLVGNYVAIPRFGATGAAWATVATFAVYSFGGLLRYRRIERFRYPFGTCTAVIGGMVGTFLVYRFFIVSFSGPTLQTAAAVVLSGIWAVALGRGVIANIQIHGRPSATGPNAVPAGCDVTVRA
jgi:O-antigen/teichoic acid export membrane protein